MSNQLGKCSAIIACSLLLMAPCFASSEDAPSIAPSVRSGPVMQAPARAEVGLPPSAGNGQDGASLLLMMVGLMGSLALAYRWPVKRRPSSPPESCGGPSSPADIVVHPISQTLVKTAVGALAYSEVKSRELAQDLDLLDACMVKQRQALERLARDADNTAAASACLEQIVNAEALITRAQQRALTSVDACQQARAEILELGSLPTGANPRGERRVRQVWSVTA